MQVPCRFLPVNVSLPVKNEVAGTKYRLKLRSLCDLLEILCTLGLKQAEGPAKQDRFRCSSASKIMNAQSHQKPYAYNEISDKLAKQGAMKNMSEMSSNNLLLSSHEINSLLKKTVYKQIEKSKSAYLLVLDI